MAFRPCGDVETGARHKVVEGDVCGRVVVLVIVVQLRVKLFLQGAAQRYALGVGRQQGVQLGRKAVAVLHKQTCVGRLPFMPVGLHGGAVLQKGVEVSHLVQHDLQKVVAIQVAVDADFVVAMLVLRPAVVAQFGEPLTCDVEVYLVLRQKVEQRFHCRRGNILAERPFEVVNIGLFHLRQGRGGALREEWRGRRWGSRNGGVCGAWACERPCRCMRPTALPAPRRQGYQFIMRYLCLCMIKEII